MNARGEIRMRKKKIYKQGHKMAGRYVGETENERGMQRATAEVTEV